ncbi:MAG: glycerophosphodiester phosphodiesterase [Alphaproteobacteria bacterium]|nr:MAG: glycerophosphodiester phosphodiesterase [Alphaproteobacteria bacterium]
MPRQETLLHAQELTSRARLALALPSVIGHRGAAACAPENTLAGLRKAQELGCRWVEFDVRLTMDKHLILLHDDRIERTTDGRGRAAALALAALRRCDAGAWYGPGFKCERIPTLADAMALLGAMGIGANVELKAVRGREAETGAAAAAQLCCLWPSHLPLPLISSFHQDALAAARARSPEIPRGILFRTVPKNWRAIAESLGCAAIHADHRRLHRVIAAEIRQSGYPLLAYTVNNPARAHMLLEWGVTSVFSDVPHILAAAGVSDRVGVSAAAEPNPAQPPPQGAVQ